MVEGKGKQTSQEKDTMMNFSLRLICGLFLVAGIGDGIWDDLSRSNGLIARKRWDMAGT